MCRLFVLWWASEAYSDVTPFVGPGLMRVGECGHAAVPC